MSTVLKKHKISKLLVNLLHIHKTQLYQQETSQQKQIKAA